MLAHRRGDVRELNAGARALMPAAGRLGSETITLGEREFRVGERVLCRRNDPRLGVRNGNRGTLVDLDAADALALETEGGTLHRLPREYAAEHLDYAYALTVHAAQGATVDRAFVLFRDEGALRQWAYVACSRARSETRLYVAAGEREPDAHAREPEAERSERLARKLSASSAQRLALEHARREHLGEVRERAEQRLAEVEAQLKSLGLLGRRRHGPELRGEITFQRTALKLACQKLAEPLREPAAPQRSRKQPGLERVGPSRARLRGLGQDLGLEL